MARRPSKNTTKLVNDTGETITLVPVSASGLRSPAITLVSKGEYMVRRKPSDTGRMLEVYDGNNDFTNVVITSDDLLKNRELTIVTKKPPPLVNGAPASAVSFEVVKVPHT